MNSTAYDFAMGSAKKIRVVQIGLGHIGLEAVKVLLGKPQFQIVGVVDIDPRKVGRKLPEFLEDKKAPDVDISASVPECLRASRADVAIHTTGSFLKDAFPQLREIVEAGAHCVSSAEELSFPRFRNPELSEELHRLAKRKKVAVLGTGVNPGFVMEVLPLCLSGVCQTAERIDVRRVLNAAKRRLPLQIKVGAGMTRAEFTR
ncbi:MAG: dihydrodipicolinate reductase, partial [Verrucomicrobiae bacterium]|nr:dihydrodipicolinate reductase [Verrucomicrobiae bacterium]